MRAIKAFHPAHGDFPHGECHLEHEIDDDEHEDGAEQPVGQERIQPVRQVESLLRGRPGMTPSLSSAEMNP